MNKELQRQSEILGAGTYRLKLLRLFIAEKENGKDSLSMGEIADLVNKAYKEFEEGV